MCATDDQTTIEQQQMDAYKQAQDLVSKQYGHQQDIFQPMASMFTDILKRGPSQTGFSDDERNDLNASAIDRTAQNFKMAGQAVNGRLAVNGGGTMPLTGGGEAQLMGEMGSAAAANLSDQEGDIKQADYAQGRQNWEDAGHDLMEIGAQENPLGYMGASTNSGNAAANTANTIASEDNSWINAAIGAVGAVGAGAATGFAKR